MRRAYCVSKAAGLFRAAVFAGTLLFHATGAAVTPGAADAPGATGTTGAAAPRRVTMTPVQWHALNLGRAVDLWLAGDLHGAAALLETIDITPTSAFTGADRAAFLLADAYRRLNDSEALRRVAQRAGDANGSAYRRWIHYCALWQSGTGEPPAAAQAGQPVDWPGARILASSVLMEGGRFGQAAQVLEAGPAGGPLAAIRDYLLALCREATGADPAPRWRRLAKRRPDHPLEADLVGAALLRLAAARLARGEDATELLERVPVESRFAARAAHVRALSPQATGEASRRLLEIREAHPHYDGRRDVELELGGVAMGRGKWEKALACFRSAEADWLAEYARVSELAAEEAAAEAWWTWEAQRSWLGEIRLAPEALEAELDRVVGRALDLRRDAPSEAGFEGAFWPDAGGERGRTGGVWERHLPSPEEWDALRALERRRGRADGELARQTRVVGEHQRRVRDRLDYLARGRDRAGASASDLSEAAAKLGDVLARLDAQLALLEAVRDSALADVASRTRRMTEQLRRHRLFILALRHFHVDGPQRDRPAPFPPGIPTPATLLTMEEAHSLETTDFLAFFGEHYDSVITRSYAEVWEPRLAGGTRQLYGAIVAQIERARRIGSAVDSAMARCEDDPELAAALALRDRRAETADSLRHAERRLRTQIARAVGSRGRSVLEREREAIDYHLADAAYEVAVHRATDPATAEDTAVVAPARRRAIERLETFLERYPEAVARGETRYRLADLLLMRARDDFQAEMARYLGTESGARGGGATPAPLVDYAPAVALYKAILQEDRHRFPHVDAVLFNLGMILSDDGSPEAAGYLERLVREYPDSPDCQEAWLRIGSDRFDREEYAAGAPMFEKAAAGSDASLAAIALYKLGWSQFEQDRFEEAADAFRRLADLYVANDELAETMDLREEAEEYLVHSLARAGGAEAFRAYFDALGGRAYEAGVLHSLGHLTRSVSLFEEAAACDELWLERYPLHPKSVSVAARLVDTYHQWNRPDAARNTKLALAPRFLPGGQWHRVNEDRSARHAGRRFGQEAYREAAAYYHHCARQTDRLDSWRLALQNYRRYLDHWPRDSGAHRMHLLAGDAAAHLEDFARAAAHFQSAAGSDSVGLARDASWHLVAVTDAWYRRSQRGGQGAARGADSLATRVLAAGDRFVERFPQDQRCPDVLWRQGNLAYAHGWYEGAAGRFRRFGERYPDDPRARRAVRMGGDALYKRADYQAAGAAYERALELARRAGEDSVAAELQATIPLCYYQHAERVAAADATDGEQRAAPLFESVALRWPGFEHADLALYRAGLGYAARGSDADAAGSWEALLAAYPASQYGRDAAAEIARVHERSGDSRAAAAAYERFSRLYAKDPDAPAALLRASDLLAGAGDEGGAADMRTAFLERFPSEVETVMEIRARRAERELAAVRAGTSTLAALLGGSGAARAELNRYLELAAANPALASPVILAQVDFMKAEAAYPAYAAMRLTQPLPQSIEVKKREMETLLEMYDACARRGVAEWSRAAAYRIGQVLVEFGEALSESERPKGLGEDDLLAYEAVLEEQCWEFFDRGEEAWSALLRQVGDATEDPGGWIARTREALWPRLAWRFLYRPEVDYPLVAASPPPGPGAN